MRIGLLIGRTHSGEVKLVDGPAHPDALNKKFKKLSGVKTNDEFSEIHLHEISLSGGRKRAAFPPPEKNNKEAAPQSQPKPKATVAAKSKP